MKGQLALSIAGIFCDLTWLTLNKKSPGSPRYSSSETSPPRCLFIVIASGSRTPFKVQHSGVDPVPNRKLSDSYFEQESP